MVYLHTGPMGVYRACFFIARAGRAATPERNRSGNQPPILCILPLVAHQLASARKCFLLKNVRAFRAQVRKRFSRGIHQTVWQDCLSPHETARLPPSKLRPRQHSACGNLKRP